MTTVNATSNVRSVVQRNVLARHPLISFFALTIVITWLFALPSLLFGLPFKPFQTAGAYGPLLAAVIVSAALGGDELKSLVSRMTNLRFGLGWYLLAIFGYVLLYLVVAGLSSARRCSPRRKWTLDLHSLSACVIHSLSGQSHR
jgi:hypothetical protein